MCPCWRGPRKSKIRANPGKQGGKEKENTNFFWNFIFFFFLFVCLSVLFILFLFFFFSPKSRQPPPSFSLSRLGKPGDSHKKQRYLLARVLTSPPRAACGPLLGVPTAHARFVPPLYCMVVFHFASFLLSLGGSRSLSPVSLTSDAFTLEDS